MLTVSKTRMFWSLQLRPGVANKLIVTSSGLAKVLIAVSHAWKSLVAGTLGLTPSYIPP